MSQRTGKVIFQVTSLLKNRYYLLFNNLDITVIIPISSHVSLNQVIIGRYVLLAFKFLGGKQFRNFKLDIFEVGTFQYRIGTYKVNKINIPKYISCTNNTQIYRCRYLYIETKILNNGSLMQIVTNLKTLLTLVVCWCGSRSKLAARRTLVSLVFRYMLCTGFMSDYKF